MDDPNNLWKLMEEIKFQSEKIPEKQDENQNKCGVIGIRCRNTIINNDTNSNSDDEVEHRPSFRIRAKNKRNYRKSTVLSLERKECKRLLDMDSSGEDEARSNHVVSPKKRKISFTLSNVEDTSKICENNNTACQSGAFSEFNKSSRTTQSDRKRSYDDALTDKNNWNSVQETNIKNRDLKRKYYFNPAEYMITDNTQDSSNSYILSSEEFMNLGKKSKLLGEIGVQEVENIVPGTFEESTKFGAEPICDFEQQKNNMAVLCYSQKDIPINYKPEEQNLIQEHSADEMEKFCNWILNDEIQLDKKIFEDLEEGVEQDLDSIFR